MNLAIDAKYTTLFHKYTKTSLQRMLVDPADGCDEESSEDLLDE